MNTKSIILPALLFCLASGSIQATKYVGGDISELPTMENAKAKYYDKNGNSISDLITFSYEQGMNAMRVRLFVDPDSFNSNNPGAADQYACQDYEYILPICKRIKEAGHKLLLDFHYSDTWADPAKQYTPAQWADLSDEELYSKIYNYTKEVLTNLISEGAAPDFIQTGNEISYGMCWGAYGASNSSLLKAYFGQEISGTNATNIARFHNLLDNAIKGCREVLPEAKIVLHTERTAQPKVLTNFYDWAKDLDYDIIGLSYYPYYHGNISTLEDALDALELKNYGKDIWIVETGAAILYTVGDSDKQYYEATDAGQNQFASDLIATLDKYNSVTGLFWWEMDYNAAGTSLTDWYNASFFANNTGKITSAFYTIAGWANGSSNEEEDNDDSYPDYYLLYNQGGDWAVPGTIFYNNQDGTYTLEDIEIYQDGSDYGWFAITSKNSTNWDVINAFRFGPVSNNEDPILSDFSTVENNTNSWQVEAGTYNLLFDANNMTLVVNVKDDDESSDNPGETPENPDENPDNPGETPENPDENPDNPGETPENPDENPDNPGETPENPDVNPDNPDGDIEEDETAGISVLGYDKNNVVFYNLQGVKVNNPKKGIYIMVVDGKNQKVYINK